MRIDKWKIKKILLNPTSLMRLFHGTDNAEIQRPTVLTLGVFDGLHLGHQLIMRTVVERARETGAVPTVITFDPHPRGVASRIGPSSFANSRSKG